MYNFKIKIADEIIEINTIYEDTLTLCKDYLSLQETDIIISTNQDMIEYERKKSFDEAIYEGHVPYDYSDGYLETVAVYRQIANKLLDKNVVVFHGAVISVDEQGYLFTAKSGTGKTTHINLWQQKFNDECIIVNGDKPLLKICEDSLYAYGTPWCGKENLNTNIKVKLKGICVLQRDTTNHIEKKTFSESLNMLLQQCYRPADGKLLIKTLELIKQFDKKVDLYCLGCNMDREAADVAYEGMKD